MPELPEVETVVRDLQPLVEGKSIATVQKRGKALRRKWSRHWAKALLGQRILNVARRGKWILIALPGDLRLVVHLGMTGQLFVVPRGTPVADHTHLIADLEPGETQLRFRDVRRFGSITLLASGAEVDNFFAEMQLGPEPFALPKGYLYEQLRTSRRCLKAILLDQQVLAGVGNIYADESLFAARLPPTQLGTRTTRPEAQRLQQAIEKVLTRAIAARGSTIRDYVGGSLLKGGFQEEFAVYGRDGQPCPRCCTPIALLRLAGRATHYCPRCQERQKSGVRSQ